MSTSWYNQPINRKCGRNSESHKSQQITSQPAQIATVYSKWHCQLTADFNYDDNKRKNISGKFHDSAPY